MSYYIFPHREEVLCLHPCTSHGWPWEVQDGDKAPHRDASVWRRPSRLDTLDSIILLPFRIEMQICIPRSSKVARLWNIMHLTEMLVQVLRGAPSPSFVRCCRWTGAWPWWLQILLIEDLQSSGSLLFRGSILDWGCLKFVRCSFFKIGCFIFYLVALMVKK